MILLALVLALGLFFRVVNLDKKPVWADETHTFSVISGYSSFSVILGESESEVIDKLSTKGIVSVGDFLKYQYPNPDRNLGDTLQKLYTDVHPPLYFLMARSWVESFGHSVSVLRSISAVLSILAFPCMYWLCLELFRSSLAGIVGTVLLLVSPIQVIYAQEARPYSLLTLVVLFSGASLLWAIRTQKKVAWFTYAISSILGLYSQYFFVLVLFGYLVYVVLSESFQLTSKLRYFLLATFASLIAFFPWAILVLRHFSDFQGSSAWMKKHTLTLAGAIRLWSENISLSFIDPRTSEYFGFGKFGLYFLIPFVLVLVAYSIYFLFIKTSKQVYLFVFTLIGSTGLPLIAIDLLLGGNRQTWPRYLIPCFLGVQICVTYLLTYKISSLNFTQNRWQRKFWLLTTAALVTSGIIFCSIISQADTWWNKYGGESTNQVSRIIHQAKDPLIVVNRKRPGTVFFYNLDSDVKLLFVRDEALETSNFNQGIDIFLLNPTKDLKEELRQQKYRLEIMAQFPAPGPVPSDPTELWKLIKSE
ncbi:glycosyltransferase family 39 protein [Floridanema aerugineum]|uniref:Glycosyltransferase family 39 protein n=1 Tax=Floridaenema aerugineum BLCC-F46 TaxID=3153654 RepID=A0ABV4XGN2_9CYAN